MIQTTITVGDVMTKNVLFAHVNHSFTQLCRLFFEMDIHHLPVLDEKGQLVGLLSASDVLKTFSFKVPMLSSCDEASLNKAISIYDLMTPNPLSITPESSISEAAFLFNKNNIQSLPVVEGGQVVGIITTRDVIRFVATSDTL